MKRVTHADALLTPSRYLAGRSWLHFHAHPSLWGIVLWGRPDRDDAQAMVPLFLTELKDCVPPHRFLVDAERLESVDPDAFLLLSQHLQSVYPVAQHRYTAVAFVVSFGLPGAAVTGFYGALTPPFPVRAFAQRSEALAWLGEGTELADDIDALVAAIRGTPAIVDQLAAHLRETLANPDAATVARALGLSERTLQRRLADAGTSFQKEVLRRRIEVAKQRLVDSDTPLTVIALELGFSTPQHFSRRFHETTGETPTQFRKQRRGFAALGRIE